eukprot:9602180-Lingulodinium_polyedra.AAC.1
MVQAPLQQAPTTANTREHKHAQTQTRKRKHNANADTNTRGCVFRFTKALSLNQAFLIST